MKCHVQPTSSASSTRLPSLGSVRMMAFCMARAGQQMPVKPRERVAATVTILATRVSRVIRRWQVESRESRGFSWMAEGRLAGGERPQDLNVEPRYARVGTALA